MSQDDKLVERIKRRPPLADFDDVRKLLEMHGYLMRRGGKHTAVFTQPGRQRLTIPTVSGKKVKRYILDQVLEALGMDS